MHTKEKVRVLSFILLIILALLQTVSLFGQSDELYRFSQKWYVTPNAGLTVFNGDLSTGFPLVNPDQFGIAFGANLGKRVNKTLDFRFSMQLGSLNGQDDFEEFHNTYMLYTIGPLIRISDFLASNRFQRKNLIYSHISVGYIQWRTDKYSLATGAKTGGNGHSGYGVGFDGRTLQGLVSLGIGYEYKINDQWHFNAEFLFAGSNTDIMDATVRGSGFLKNDWFNSITFGASYQFDWKKPEDKQKKLMASYLENKHKARSRIVADTLTSIKLDPSEVSAICSISTELVVPGQAVKVQLKINKGDLNGKCLIKGLIPAGYTVSNSATTGNMNFFADGRDIIVQSDRTAHFNQLSISFEITTDTACGGEKSIFFTGTIKDNNQKDNKFHCIQHFYQEAPLLLESETDTEIDYSQPKSIDIPQDSLIIREEIIEPPQEIQDSVPDIRTEEIKLEENITLQKTIPDSTSGGNASEKETEKF